MDDVERAGDPVGNPMESPEYLAVECTECTIEEHKKYSKKERREWHKCHCKILERQKFNELRQRWERVLHTETRGFSEGERIQVQYMNEERVFATNPRQEDTEWISDT